VKLFRHTLGDGPPLVILHGLFGISDNWMSVGKALAGCYRVIIPDLRNHGRSPHAEAFGYFPMMEDLLEMLEESDYQSVILLGHSMGGKLAMHFAVQYPEMVQKLIVVDISPRQTRVRQTHLRMLHAMNAIDFDQITSRQEVEMILADHIETEALRLFVMKNLIRIDRQRFAWRINLGAIERNIDEIMEGIPAGSGFDQPTLFIRGGDSDYITGEDLPVIRMMFPHHQMVTIPEAGHWVHADQPEEFLMILMNFLGPEQ
jgi:esterase